ncbi:hypothetical protein [Phytomonospora endophytica]|uniref:Uncharacterized protein n=1 Tax=Phytomonospora endophytica TaxID=714109 RepID=A0A841FZ77_9ACTN|nr:hypothetical protein [Phytomonospora endophytica]MBB6037250.1 hypothetical protein [Phytomonospora endophytica]GIG71250.1 hypothetical protein Pen01_75450 [Phytomonospora endophytica]
MTVPQQPAYPAQGPPPQQAPMIYAPPPPPPAAYHPTSSWWREKMPFGPAPFALTLVGVLLIAISLLGPAAVYTRDYGDYSEIYDIPIFGSFYSFPDYTTLSNLDFLPVLLTLGLLFATVASTGSRRLGAKIGTIAFGVIAIAMLVSQVLNWKALLLETNHRTEGLDPSPDPSDTFDEDSEIDGESVTFGWGVILLIIALVVLIAAAATTFDRTERATGVPGPPVPFPQSPTGSFPQVPPQPSYDNPHGMVVTQDPPPQPGQWQQPPPPHQ